MRPPVCAYIPSLISTLLKRHLVESLSSFAIYVQYGQNYKVRVGTPCVSHFLKSEVPIILHTNSGTSTKQSQDEIR